MTKPQMRIGIIGAYGHPNFGDQLLFNLLYQWLMEIDSNLHICVPWGSQAIDWPSGKISIGGKWKSLSKCDKVVFGGGGYLGEPGERAVRQPHQFTKTDKIGKALHLPPRFGGGYFGENGYLRAETRRFWEYRLITDVLRLRQIPYGILGVGLGPVTTTLGRWAVKKVLERAEFVCLRDRESTESAWLLSPRRVSSIENTADLVLSQSVPVSTIEPRRLTRVAIHLGPSSVRYIGKAPIIDFVREVNKRCEEPLSFLTDCRPPGNSNLTDLEELVKECGEDIHFAPYQGTKELVAKIRELGIILTSKLHVGIVAYANGVFPISIAEHIKTQRFYRQVGLETVCFTFSQGGLKKALESFKAYMGAPRHIAEALSVKREEIRSKALENRECLSRFILSE